MNTRFLFIGNFLSKQRGTKGIAERLAERSNEFSGVSFQLSSYQANKLLRLLDIIRTTLFARYQAVVIDVYSGAYFYIVRVATHLAKSRRKKIILNLHGGKLHELEQQQTFVVRRVLARAQTIITPSLFLKNAFEKKGYKIEYLPNFIDAEKFVYKRNPKPNSLLWVRAFAAIYNPEMPIRVLQLVRQELPDATLTMVGPDHGLLKDCETLIESLNLQAAVTLTGRIENHNLPDFFHSHAVYLNTTSYESFGLAVMEAASCGIPVVSTRVGEIPYIWVDSKEILLVEPGDEKSMAAHIIGLLKSEASAIQISKNARTRAEQFSWVAIKERWVSLLGRP